MKKTKISRELIIKIILIVCIFVILLGLGWLIVPKIIKSSTSSSNSDLSSNVSKSSASQTDESGLLSSKALSTVLSEQTPMPVNTITITKEGNGDIVTMDRQNFNLIGRFMNLPDDPQWYTTVWTGATIEFSINGSSAQCYLSGEDPDNLNKGVFVGVFVDGSDIPVKTIKVTNEGWYPVVENLAEGNHVVRLFRLDEPIGGELRFSKIRVSSPGTLNQPPTLPKLKIEIIGDSITAGYGNAAAFASDKFRLDQENGYMTYGAILGRRLNAQVHILGWSGIGIYQNNDGKKTNTMTTLYWLTAPNVNRRVQWDFASYQPDVIIVNLGTNDMASNAPEAEFIDAYVKFVKQIRISNPDSWIICTMGVMGTRLVPAMESAVLQMKNSGDTKIYSLPLQMQLASDGYGADGHPSIATHKKLADIFYNKIQELLK